MCPEELRGGGESVVEDVVERKDVAGRPPRVGICEGGVSGVVSYLMGAPSRRRGRRGEDIPQDQPR